MNEHEISVTQLLEKLEKSLDFSEKILYNIYEAEEKLFEAEYTDEAKEQLNELDKENYKKITTAIQIFEQIGTKYPNINNLGRGLFELKPKGVRAYFRYHPNRRKIIIIGLVVLKKSQKAPRQNIEQAERNIADYLKKRNTVVVNLKRVTPEQGKRIIDFVSGTLYAIGGNLQKLGPGIFLCTPKNINVQGKIAEEEEKNRKTKNDDLEL